VTADYAATGDRVEEVLARLRRSRTYASDIDRQPASAHRPRPETMAAFLDELEARHGGAASWLADHGFAEELPLLRAKLL
jgi:hypothetical protein